MGMVDARGACHGSDGRYATASTCRGSGLSEEGAIVLGVLGGAALVGLIVWLAARPSRPPPGAATAASGGPYAGPLPPDRRARSAQDEAFDEARAMGQRPTRSCMDNNGAVHVVRGLCSEHRMREIER